MLYSTRDLNAQPMMRSVRNTAVLMARQLSSDHRQLHAPNANADATSAFQRIQRTGAAKDRAVNTLCNDQSAFCAAAIRSSWSMEGTEPKVPLAPNGSAIDLDRHKPSGRANLRLRRGVHHLSSQVLSLDPVPRFLAIKTRS